MCLCPNSGGNWNNSSNAGVWALNLSNSLTNSNTNYGFRSDFVSPHTSNEDSGTKGDTFLHSGVKSAFMVHSSKAICFEGPH